MRIQNFLRNSHASITWISVEFILLFIAMPIFLFFHATRWNVHMGLWSICLYALVYLYRQKNFSWKKLWHGAGWAAEQKRAALLRFAALTALVIFFTYFIVPERMLGFPMKKPWFWLLVMFLYPILSVLPQELLFRSFFFQRYQKLFSDKWMMIFASAIVFGFVHIVFHNWVSPTFCLIAGLIFAYSYSQHRSLKWATIEHAAYGCMVFTVGIGFYFLVGGTRF